MAGVLASELADQYLVMERGEIVQRGLGKAMEAEGVRQRMSIGAACSSMGRTEPTASDTILSIDLSLSESVGE